MANINSITGINFDVKYKIEYPGSTDVSNFNNDIIIIIT